MDFRTRVSAHRLSAVALTFGLGFAFALCGCSPASETQTGSGSPVASTSTTGSSAAGSSTAGDSGATTTAGASTQPTAAGDDPQTRQPKDGDEVAVMDTSMGKIVLMFFPDKAPNHVANFKKLANKGFYDGTKFHRVIPGFMIQGGDPNTKTNNKDTWGQGGPGYNINAEFNDVHHARGILSMARSSDPNSAGSQFFIMVADNAGLDHQYTAFGKVVSGMDVVDKIVNVPVDMPGQLDRPKNPPVIKSVKIVKWPVK